MTDTKLQLTNLAHGLSRRASMPLRYSEEFAKSFFQIIEEGLLHDNMVKVKGFGTFKLVDVNARESINVNNGQRFEIAGHTKVTFTPDPVLRDAVNKPFVEFQTVILNENVDTALMEDLDGDLLSSKEQPESKADGAEETRLEQKAEIVDVPQTAVTGRIEEQVQTEVVEEIQAPQVEEIVEASPLDVVENTEDDESGDCFETSGAAEETEEAATEEVAVEGPADESASDEELNFSSTADADNNYAQSFSTNSHTEHPMDRHSHTSLWILLTAVLFIILGYCLGYYWHPIDLPELSSSTSQTVENSTLDELNEDVGNVLDSTVVTSSSDLNHLAATPGGASAEQAASAADYPQLDGGEYIIVGVLQADTMTAGKTLLNMAIKYYGDKECYKYICVMNGIENPDIVPLNMPLRIPKLQKK